MHDRLVGGAGNDILIGGAGDDLFVFNNGDGGDTINDFVAGAGSADVVDVTDFGFDFATFDDFRQAHDPLIATGTARAVAPVRLSAQGHSAVEGIN